MKIDFGLTVGVRRLIVLSYVYTDALGGEHLATDVFVSESGDFGPVQEAADRMHEIAKKEGGKVTHALATMVPHELLQERRDDEN